MTNDQEFEGTLHLDIKSIHALRDALRYLKQVWPGAPARPVEEQEFIEQLLVVLNQLSLEHSFVFLDQEKRND